MCVCVCECLRVLAEVLDGCKQHVGARIHNVLHAENLSVVISVFTLPCYGEVRS